MVLKASKSPEAVRKTGARADPFTSHRPDPNKVADRSYDFSRFLVLPKRGLILVAAIFYALWIGTQFDWSSHYTRLTSSWQRALGRPLCIDAPGPEHSRCQPRRLCQPQLFGGKVLSVEASEVNDYEYQPNGWLNNSTDGSYFSPTLYPISFCNITVTYTHPGYNDKVRVTLWLPSSSAWNGRFQGTGGGGFTVGFGSLALYSPVFRGFAAASTDGGVPSGDPNDWALSSEGNVNLNTLHTYSSTALADMTVIGQQLTHYYYGKPANYSYWNGCSTGGRQGIELAQSYPNLYDGILATAPAIHLPSLGSSMIWPQVLMNELQAWPQPCELVALTAAAIAKCDELDGVKDGIISSPIACKVTFDPFSLVGTTISCPEHPQNETSISHPAAAVAAAVWRGATSSQGEQLWYGLNQEAKLTSLAGTECTYTQSKKDPKQYKHTCSKDPSGIAAQWTQLFLLKRPFPEAYKKDPMSGKLRPVRAESDPTKDINQISHADYDELFFQGNREYNSIVGSDDPHLAPFARRGGKMITWHGLADELIPPGGSIQYYKDVQSHYEQYQKAYQSKVGEADSGVKTDAVADFYRLYMAPGVAHCMGGPGPYPGSILDSAGALEQLMDWVENGTKPDSLSAVSNADERGQRWRRPLCAWPKVAKFRGKAGEERAAESWICDEKDEVVRPK